MNPQQLEEAQKYINTHISGILEKLTVDILEDRPPVAVQYMVDWLERNGQEAHRETLRKMAHRPMGVETSESEDEENEHEAEAFTKQLEAKRVTLKSQRKSISAEAYGHYNPKGSFQPKVVEKDAQTQALIRQLLAQSFLFRHLDASEVAIIVSAMEIRHFKAGDAVIRQNEDGNELYVVGSGQLRCTKLFPDSAEETFLKNYEPGEYFGELALLYNAPRAASITALGNATLYSLDRECFNHIVKESAVRNRNIYEQFLAEVEVLHSLDQYERSKLCDCLKIQIFEPGQRVIRESERGDTFYIIIEGKAQALKINPATGKEEPVWDYKEKMYFGELALLRDEPRAASIVAQVG